MWAISVLGNAKSNRHRKTHLVESGGATRKYMFLLGEILPAKAGKKSAEAIVVMIPAERQEERRAEESRKKSSLNLDPEGEQTTETPRSRNCGGYRSIKAWLTKHLELEVNEAKSGAGSSGDSQLLGFWIHETGNVSIAPKALQRLKERVRQLWDARQSLKSEELRTQWQRYITGWWNYFGYADWRREVRRLSGWIRRHMRKCFWLRWHSRAGRYNALWRLGVRGRRLNVAGCRRGAWPMATHVVVNEALKTATLKRYGFTLPWELADA